MPQIIMLNHAASTNFKNSEARAKAKANRNSEKDKNDPVVFNGKRLSEMSKDEVTAYYAEIV